MGALAVFSVVTVNHRLTLQTVVPDERDDVLAQPRLVQVLLRRPPSPRHVVRILALAPKVALPKLEKTLAKPGAELNQVVRRQMRR